MGKHNRIEEILQIIKDNPSLKDLTILLDDYHESDIADVLNHLTKEERLNLYQAFNLDRLSNIFSYLDDATEYLKEIEIHKAASIVNNMDADDAIDVLENIDDEIGEQILKLMDDDTSEDIKLIQSFAPNEIGSKMTTNFISLKKNYTIRQAMKEVISQAAENDNMYTLYVCEDDGTLYGTLALKDLIQAREKDNFEDLVSTGYPFFYATEIVTDCLEKIKNYSEQSLPILDANKKLIGIITSQDIIEVVGDEFEEDYAKFAGLSDVEDTNETVVQSVKKRLPWLVLLLFLGIGISSVVGLFESVVEQIAIIVCFQSLILGMAGNVGTQSLAVTIRMLMDDTISSSEKTKLVFKEIKIGFTNGLLLGLTSFIFIGLYVWLFKHNTLLFAFSVSGCVGISLLVAMIIASFVGTIIPMFFKKINIDPAVASGPLITTINDLVAVVSYYGIAWLLLIKIMGL